MEVISLSASPHIENMKPKDFDNWGYAVISDLVWMFVGDKLGEGSYREVYEYLPDKEQKVLKLENHAGSFRNIHEWQVWQNCPERYKKWLAPCYAISPCGTWLVQQRVDTVTRAPKKIPSFLDDVKPNNWGLLKVHGKDRLVMHDYGHTKFIANGFKYSKMVKAKSQWQ